jgi:tetratricopeptide (TPR) repeat protein
VDPRRSAERRVRWWAVALVTLVCALPRSPMGAQEQQEPPEVVRALELESLGKNREAAQLFRAALRKTPTTGGLLGLERVYAELGTSDSLLAPLDSLIAQHPREPIYRSVQLRTLQMLRREDALRAAFDRWTQVVPRDATPYREYARLLIELGRTQQADSVVQLSRRVLGMGSRRELALETAQLRAAQGEWEQSAIAWREALTTAPYLASAASYALAPTPAATRDVVRALFLTMPPQLGTRRALAELELSWGRPADAWEALRVLPADTASAVAWREFGERAFAEERYAVARQALAAALGVHRTFDLALEAATAALRAGAPAEVFTLAPLSDADSARARTVRDLLPLHVEALAALGRAADAERQVERYDRWLAPGQRRRLSRSLASAWVRAGDIERARSALRVAGADGDSSDASGWLALYEGRLAEARVMLRNARDPSPELAFALGIVSRTRGDEGTALGAGFLALARGDSSTAASRFIDAAARHPETASALLLGAARIRAARGDDTGATELWSRIVSQQSDTPEAAEAELDWARTLRRRGDATGAIAHLEHLILSAPQSALLPQARRELDLARAAVPSR